MVGTAKTSAAWIEFSNAKGPDFTSRLSGHLNIVGVNRADEDDTLYLIRRAIAIRTILTSLQELSDGEKAQIDTAISTAVLEVPEYLHGVRSIQMLLSACSNPSDGVSSSSIPPLHQLNMHVDGHEFMKLLEKSSR